ncbi:hypothetical protein QLV94_08160 [Streptococcus equi subsp. zooepidemicus]|uniref:hypothetical protein n=1 Tax=Streptococcus equi TaxID=1336 RepID=UPI0024A81E4B|nr:hypothetical protein [Streptococcus equi]MDI5952742.1 hypothetical protein [Streptococcus equi subsp. zooepidemicus]MDI6074681.1 hypothetical protein [Streptococcus equi subsp. zooepidemicus]
MTNQLAPKKRKRLLNDMNGSAIISEKIHQAKTLVTKGFQKLIEKTSLFYCEMIYKMPKNDIIFL